MIVRTIILSLSALLITSCERLPSDAARPDSALEFPQADRPVSKVVSNEFSNEDARDERGEAVAVMDLANINPGMTVADIGAGEGYYTVRLAQRVGSDGRVLAQDISRDALQRLGQRVERERLEIRLPVAYVASACRRWPDHRGRCRPPDQPPRHPARIAVLRV